ncbi:DUF2306 domain-containing protein [Streptomyces sp. LS1784]|uniref:DUF2306 domain-containing protein n=1 Tax=Streptomyces sp. LS1784 TaxID=2851533 RepID=UPI001CCB08CC|nr:DUF2306 domain-containing protein [Streptomyces sp. LS1784]
MRITRAGWAVMTVLSMLIVVISAKYISFDPAVFFEHQRATYLSHEVPLYIHIFGAVTALAVGPWQFSTRLRERSPRRHRRIGVTYLLACLVGGVGALLLAPVAYGGAVAGLGFACLAVAWLVTGGAGLRAILDGRVIDHRRWMIRSFALTFAAVTLRLMLLAATAARLDFRTSYTAIAWLCWVPNLLLACWFTRRRPVAGAVA